MTTSREELFMALKSALLDAFATKAALEPVARNAQNKSLDQLALGDNLEQIVERLISRARSEFWLPVLIQAALGERPQHPELRRLHEEWNKLVFGPTDHFKILLLPGKMVLLDRQPLRDALAGLDTANGPRVLIVDGDAESGKTYSLQYISYLSAARGTFRFAAIDLERVRKNAANKVDAITLGEAIVDALVGASGYADPIDFNLTTWIDQYCNWLGRHLPSDRTRWLVLDHFGKVTAEQSAYDLVATLAMRTYLELSSLRLVLLNYRDHEWLQARVVGAVEYEWITQISQEHLVRFFSELYADQSQRRGEVVDVAALAPQVIASVKRVLERVPEHSDRRLEVLGRMTWAEVESIVLPGTRTAGPVDALEEEARRLLAKLRAYDLG